MRLGVGGCNAFSTFTSGVAMGRGHFLRRPYVRAMVEQLRLGSGFPGGLRAECSSAS
jgi:hypothetical protein